VLREGDHPADQLRGLACQLHPQWAAELRELTGIDTGYRRCGGLYLARTPGEAASLAAWADMLSGEGIEVMALRPDELRELEPGLSSDFNQTVRSPLPSTQYSVLGTSCYLLPAEAQLRNPRHLKALLAACNQSGVTITSNAEVTGFKVAGHELTEVATTQGPLRAAQYCFTSGAWTGALLQRLHLSVGILPIRGQIVLFRCERPPITRIINEGSRYLVPRDDGHVLAGSTEEEVGFDKRNTDDAINELTGFARTLVPALQGASIEQTWSGLRPGSFDGLPYLGRLPGLQNAFLAAGHFRTGLFLSPATAVVISQLIRGQKPQIDLTPFRISR
jgi:glycine oxidase